MSARRPGASRPRSCKPKKSAVSLVCRLTSSSIGSRGPRRRSRPQCKSMYVGTPASTIEAQCAPPSLSPNSVPESVQHLANGFVVAADVIHDREKQVSVLGFGEVVVGDLVRRSSGAGGNRGAARLVRRLVIRWISHHEELVPARGDELAELREPAHLLGGRLFGENAPPQRRIAQAPALLWDAQPIELAVAWSHRERV